MRCDNCKHWVQPEKGEWCPVRRNMGVCAKTPHADDMMEWEDTDDPVRVILPKFASHTASVVDASGWSAKLLTKAEHFCAMFDKVAS